MAVDPEEPDFSEPHFSEERASGGSKEGVVRWVLGISLLLALIAMSLAWIIPSLTG